MLKSRISIFSFGVIFALVSGSCVLDWGSLSQPDPSALINESNLEDSVQRVSDGNRRGRSSGSSGRRYKCREDSSCSDICKDLFDDIGVVENCLDLSITKVKGRDNTRQHKGFEYILDVFDEEITYNSLTNIDGASFGALMGLSVEHWVNLTDDVSEQEAKALLAWIASDKDVAKVVREHGADGNYAGFNSYEGLIRLIKEVGNRTGCDEFKDALINQHLTGRFTFCCIAKREKNNIAEGIISDINKLESCDPVFACAADGGSNCPL